MCSRTSATARTTMTVTRTRTMTFCRSPRRECTVTLIYRKLKHDLPYPRRRAVDDEDDWTTELSTTVKDYDDDDLAMFAPPKKPVRPAPGRIPYGTKQITVGLRYRRCGASLHVALINTSNRHHTASSVATVTRAARGTVDRGGTVATVIQFSCTGPRNQLGEQGCTQCKHAVIDGSGEDSVT